MNALRWPIMRKDMTPSSYSRKRKYLDTAIHKSSSCFRYLAQEGVQVTGDDVIMNGTNIMKLKSCGVTIKDFKCFTPGESVATLPKTFGLQERKKGYFPHAFNTKENRFYKGVWPDVKEYWPDKKLPKERLVFLEWYEKQKDKVRHANFSNKKSKQLQLLHIAGVRYAERATRIL